MWATVKNVNLITSNFADIQIAEKSSTLRMISQAIFSLLVLFTINSLSSVLLNNEMLCVQLVLVLQDVKKEWPA